MAYYQNKNIEIYVSMSTIMWDIIIWGGLFNAQGVKKRRSKSILWLRVNVVWSGCSKMGWDVDGEKGSLLNENKMKAL